MLATPRDIRSSCLLAIAILTLGARVTATAPAPDGAAYWPQWRGPNATGASETADPPVEWSETNNVRWKVEVPGRGSASPVIWGDRLFLLTAVPADVTGDAAHQPQGGVRPRKTHRFVVLAIDRRDGHVIWERVATELLPHEATHQDNGTWASASAVTDGQHVIANFESSGLYAYDMDGTLVWKKDLGDKQMRNEFGEGTTPVLHGNHLVHVWDHQGQSFIVALDKRTGEELWRGDRDEIDSWATPLVVDMGGRAQVVTSGMNRVRSYDLETGELVWHADGLTMNPIPSPVARDGLVFVTAGYRGNDLKAIRLADARGDLTGTKAIAWALDRDTPYVPSPLLYGGILYILKSNNGLLSALDAATGTPHFQLQRLDATPNVFASPVGAGSRVYIVGREGTTLVIRNGPTFDVLATNTLDDHFDASPALADKTMYLRGYRFLYAVGAT